MARPLSGDIWHLSIDDLLAHCRNRLGWVARDHS